MTLRSDPAPLPLAPPRPADVEMRSPDTTTSPRGTRRPAPPARDEISFTRRAFFVGATASAIAASATVLALRVLPEDPDPLDPIRRIGQAYIEQYPGESSPTELTSVLGLGGGAIPLMSVFERHEEIADEFARRETVVVDGWTLSRTEARAAALLYLASRS